MLYIQLLRKQIDENDEKIKRFSNKFVLFILKIFYLNGNNMITDIRILVCEVTSRTNAIAHIHCNHVILQRFLSTQSSSKINQTFALPVGTGLSTVYAPNNLPQIYVPSLVRKIKIKLDLQGKLRERQKVLYQAVSYYMIDSSVDFDRIQYELDMSDAFVSFGKIFYMFGFFTCSLYLIRF
ncbi:unnamed protein product [Rotaria sordida]|uniref:Uncharacterized protein n=1 Tax=Rotaria sordida TaxID=392033 RepID=A0A815L9X3_9BILA|nr:unnamed protein product [Rotaria sordida]